MPNYECQEDTAAGLVRVRKEDDGLWSIYLDDRKWVSDFRQPEWAVDAIASVDFAFPDGVKFFGNSSVLDLSDNISDWRRVRIK
ncbi:MAG: hypothetical protein Q8K18_03220 [Burkholderiales bacterium]|nr:hypothetical protein [Burkholderiales bacterium]